jgi:hypothetical protein
VNVVSMMSVPGTYRRSLENSAAGRIDQWPASGSRIAPKTAGES